MSQAFHCQFTHLDDQFNHPDMSHCLELTGSSTENTLKSSASEKCVTDHPNDIDSEKQFKIEDVEVSEKGDIQAESQKNRWFDESRQGGIDGQNQQDSSGDHSFRPIAHDPRHEVESFIMAQTRVQEATYLGQYQDQQTLRSLYHSFTQERKKANKKMKGGSTPTDLTHFWRDFNNKFKEKLISILREDEQFSLIKKLEQMIEESLQKLQATSRNKREDKWYFILLKDIQFQPYLLLLFSKHNFQALIDKMQSQFAEKYRNNRIPLLAYITLNIPYADFRKFRDFYFKKMKLK